MLTLKQIVAQQAEYDQSYTTMADILKPEMEKIKKRLEEGACQHKLYITELHMKTKHIAYQANQTIQCFKFLIPNIQEKIRISC